MFRQICFKILLKINIKSNEYFSILELELEFHNSTPIEWMRTCKVFMLDLNGTFVRRVKEDVGPLCYVFWQFVESFIKMKWLLDQMWRVWQEQLRPVQWSSQLYNGMQRRAGQGRAGQGAGVSVSLSVS